MLAWLASVESKRTLSHMGYEEAVRLRRVRQEGVEAMNMDPKARKVYGPDDIMPFGKHRGKP